MKQHIKTRGANMTTFLRLLATALALLMGFAGAAQSAPKLDIIGFQMSSETHARVVNAAADAARAQGWTVQILNSKGDMPTHIRQLQTAIQSKPDGIDRKSTRLNSSH